MSDEKPKRMCEASSVADKDHLPHGTPEVGIRAGHAIISILIPIYFISILCLGYWYWMRPVRADQFKDAQTKWRAIAQVYNIPVPKDERWGW
jgi:hypothetical protein